ncbi:hypothetical protein [Clostridium perfringens]|uniref:hypothetical protein n=1 Tax=Clostridium perfringens TaxID=1502 RepID=UPI0018E4D673|nr:hypothetical protein [Clostridium perfringens]MBI5987847.1 hypothetical protein [Clostridium perfringens]MDM1014552.1 hypothetical protein [Clostridium perfringens]MDZ5024839.1 hypothetical protein [Clostridium perfringens]MDZ5062146.1 hypothetical protein [Clostridium perfringens]
MELLLEKEMQELIEKNQRFMSKLIKENRYLQNEINIYKDKLQKLENVDKTNKYNVDKLEKENFILKEERKMFDLKLKVSEESLSKAEERICALENEVEKLDMEIYSLMADKDCNDNEIVKDVLLSNSSEVSLCLDKIKELIIKEKCDEAEELFNNNSDLIISSEGDFSEEDIITVLYLAFYNNSLGEFLKNKELSAYYNSSNEEAKVIKILKEEEALKIGESIEECYQSYIDLKPNIFENINPLIKKYILANNLDYSYEYYNNVTVIVNLIIRNRYKNKKCFIKIRDKYCLVNVFEKLESENKETYIIKEDYNKYCLNIDKKQRLERDSINHENKNVSNPLNNDYDNIIQLYSDGNLPEVKNNIEKLLDKSILVEKLSIDKVNSLLFMGNITGVDKYKMERVLKVNTLEASFENIAYRKIVNKKEAYKYIKDNRNNFKKLDSRIKEKLLNELTELQMRRERLGSSYFNEQRAFQPQKEQVVLSDESELKKLGYSTTLSESERWNILINKAVPKLGSRKVVWYLRMFIKINKYRKDRLNAVQKWEKDLEKILKVC